MKYRISIVLCLLAFFHSIYMGMGKASSSATATTTVPTGPTRDFYEKEADASDQSADIKSPIAAFRYHPVTPVNMSNSTWKNLNIYMGPNILNEQTYLALQVIEAMAYAACINWTLYDDASRPDGDYVNITTMENGCWADVGRIGGEQRLNLAKHCGALPTVSQAVLLSLGIRHEHCRADRDDFVTIHWENIFYGFAFAFQKEPREPFPPYEMPPYNTESLMHYGSFAFSKNGRPTITKKDGGLIPNNEVLTDGDMLMLQLMYRCY